MPGAPATTSTAGGSQSMRDPAPRVHYEHSVTHRRAGWQASTPSRRRTFETELGARRYAQRLIEGHGALSPVTVVVIERRLVGEWQTIHLEQAES